MTSSEPRNFIVVSHPCLCCGTCALPLTWTETAVCCLPNLTSTSIMALMSRFPEICYYPCVDCTSLRFTPWRESPSSADSICMSSEPTTCLQLLFWLTSVCRREYLALIGSLILVALEVLVRIITLGLRECCERLVYLQPRTQLTTI